MKKIEDKKVLEEIFEEEAINANLEENEKIEEIYSIRPNIVWMINKDVLDEIKLGVENNIFTQVNVRITNTMYLAKLGKTKSLYDAIKKNPLSINQTTINGRTALMFAAQFGNINCLKLLLVAGADIDAQDEHGASALMLAAFFGQDEAVKVLLENGANKMLKDCNGINAKMLSKKNNDTLVYKIIDEFDTNNFNSNEIMKLDSEENFIDI